MPKALPRITDVDGKITLRVLTPDGTDHAYKISDGSAAVLLSQLALACARKMDGKEPVR